MINQHKFPYIWNIKDAIFTKDKGKVFSTFSCGGGSSMGYKLAGFDVIGCNEIDKKLMNAYVANHHPKYAFLEPIQHFKNRMKASELIEHFGSKENLEMAGGAPKWEMPEELYDLDVLDGSPPCSSFSMASSNREDFWGQEKVFREGQEMQVLDTLFFDYIDLAAKLQPKVCVAENVKGLLAGEAKAYVIRIYKEFEKAGYYCQHFLLDASKMGVPQRRERVFFIALRKDLAQQFLVQKDMFTHVPEIRLKFNEPPIIYSELADYEGDPITEYSKRAWDKREPGDDSIADSKKRVPGMKVSDMNTRYVYDHKVCQTLTAKGACGSLLFSKPIRLSRNEFCKIGSFPLDYNFTKNGFGYVIGMSVPPIVMAQIATRIHEQWLSKL